MPRKWKNSDEKTFFSDKSTESRLEKLRYELIPNYGRRKYQEKRNDNHRENYNKKRK